MVNNLMRIFIFPRLPIFSQLKILYYRKMILQSWQVKLYQYWITNKFDIKNKFYLKIGPGITTPQFLPAFKRNMSDVWVNK